MSIKRSAQFCSLPNWHLFVQSQQYKHFVVNCEHILHLFLVSNVNFEQVNVRWSVSVLRTVLDLRSMKYGIRSSQFYP